MAQIHNIVVIGASFGGLPTAHGLLRDILPKLGTEQSYKVTLINPTEEFLWKIGTPRTIAKPEKLPLEKALISFVPTFAQYGDKFEFIKAYATSVDAATRMIGLSTGHEVRYDSLVIASGTKFESDLWSTTSGSERLKAAYKEVHEKLSKAKSVFIAGGGAAGVETAGEFGEEYGARMDITLLSGSTGLLARLHNKDVGKDAQSRLERYGVKVINDKIRVSSVSQANNKYTIILSNGQVKNVDIYINATGDKPNSDFLPTQWLDENKRVKTHDQTLRLDVTGIDHVYAIGAVASYSDGSVADVKYAVKPLLYSMEVDLKGIESGPRNKNIYKKMTTKDTQLVPVGSSGGVGILFGWRVPNFMIRFIKARDFMVGNVPSLIQGQI